MIDNEGVRSIESRSCLLCGGDGRLLYNNLRDRLFGAPGVWALMECSVCQLVWLSPQPLPEDVGKLYCHYFTHSAEVPRRSHAGIRKCVKASILESSFGYKLDGSNKVIGSVLSRIGPLREIVGGGVMWLKASDGKRLLDVGCGNGAFLDHMRQLGWEVAGVEPDGDAVLVARGRGLEVYQGSLEEARFPDDHFDVITMNHVIEHVIDPIRLFRECGRVLKPDGKLVVVTPNIDSLGRQMFGSAWLHWDPPRHLHLFSPRSLRTCAERAGLRVSDLRTTARNARFMYYASAIIRRDGALPGGSPARTGMDMRGFAFQAIEHARGGGEEIVMEARRG